MGTRQGLFWRRPDDDPAPAQPLVVRSVGHQHFSPLMQEDASLQYYHKIQWCVQGSAEIRMAGRRFTMQSGQIAHYASGSEHWARAGREGMEICWLTFTAGIPDAILAAFGLEQPGVFDAGPCPVEDFLDVHRCVSDIGQRGERRAGVLAYRLLALAGDSCRQQQRGPVIERALTLLQRKWQDPDFGIAELAERCHCHRSRLSRLFRQGIGVAPSRYLTRLRLQRAAQLLREGSISSERIAEACGFNDGSYFARVFRRAYGMSPGDFRQQFGA